ncbi:MULTISPECIES: hypothetical protein [unclassified Micromonospora]|uniref:hypothetical protein n=1 Tax=unclassified Micromonospora TaxID=2617518 RepID=UPI0022B733CA|nr:MULTISPECIES: hypothetical protein [unclassified Micromonospora]MCZ7418857.1 hypothetical protein [Verrucosispora sp. WMMA2121]WBB92546.1 hypothetical protein O7597_05955 [Verrucosispora sp. WMMC514]
MSPLHAGDLLRLTRSASVQFHRPILFRVIRELGWTTYDGWFWLDGYQLDERGQAVARREVFLRRAGVTLLRPAPRRVAPRPGATLDSPAARQARQRTATRR